MNNQIITTPSGDRLVVLPEADYQALVAAAEDAADIVAVCRFKERLASGEEGLVPAAIVDRLVAGENAIRVWREHRGLSASSLAEKAGIARAFLSQIETGNRDGTVATLKKIADALLVTVDDLI
ncbi:transcriptional regulator, XRE family [Ancylobacter novellus DSM 506]|uniref:Transcriptional regulator, XRE family n=1 Tax=Ancylobacter novellus (strain ATCC 8093 / DSM 506 / JCM 20403 / CCM 1077 / IAM 12100 / NBRC 12443 / NCIMB 10456) TaxID=639283 RepID=D7A566_ANCN5|nr:helix-turn-helix transcriptional regulator [Ancylobacter novellus]ADH89954.1 transcriptional regulator, XRE family [Ancylobacter novellus DSM 506]